jgi:hypothetical protein
MELHNYSRWNEKRGLRIIDFEPLQRLRYRITQCERAGSEINQLIIGEALSHDFDGKVINPNGVEIDLPFWAFKRIKKLHLLERDRESGMRRISARIFGLMPLWEGPDFRADRKYRAFDPGYQRACSKDSGYASAFLKALGRDCSGLAAPAIERIRDYESDLEHSRTSDELCRVQIEELISQIRAKRRIA